MVEKDLAVGSEAGSANGPLRIGAAEVVAD